MYSITASAWFLAVPQYITYRSVSLVPTHTSWASNARPDTEVDPRMIYKLFCDMYLAQFTCTYNRSPCTCTLLIRIYPWVSEKTDDRMQVIVRSRRCIKGSLAVVVGLNCHTYMTSAKFWIHGPPCSLTRFSTYSAIRSMVHPLDQSTRSIEPISQLNHCLGVRVNH